ncbi:MAG TPA: DUF4097 family beta strand repeat-containing protein [Terriglobales bacterium]|nr:DUF4097 family beta strand repeat-containing protein [Terriglobales bacterium]
MSDQYYEHRRSLGGPVILILIGVVILLVKTRVISGSLVAHWFAHYWPLLLILIGIIKLIEYYFDKERGAPARGVGAGLIILVIILIVFGLMASSAERVNWSALGGELNIPDDSDFMAGVFGSNYSYTQTLQQDFPKDASLRVVVSDRGDVTITTWDQPSIKVEVSKKVRARDQNEANKIDENTHPTINTEGNVVTLNANTSGAGTGAAESDLNIYIPAKAAVDISTRRGSITLQDRQGDVRASTTHGDVTVTNINGSVSADMRSGSITADKITGNLQVNGQVNDTNISNVNGSVRLTGEYFGQLNLAKIAGGVTFHTSRTDLELGKLDGDLTMESGDLRAREIAGPVRLVTKSKDIHLDGVTGDVKLENENGLVEVHADKLPLGTMNISNSNGDIKVAVPSKAQFDVEARAQNGEINTDFNGIKVENSGDNSQASGSNGSGGAKLQISNEHGNVDIRKLS